MMRLLAVLATIIALTPATQVGGVSGDVRDRDGLLIRGATVAVAGPMTPKRWVMTDSSGQFRFADLTPGEYELTATFANFATFRQKFQIAEAEQVRTTITLAIGVLIEQMQITAKAGRVPASPRAPAATTQASAPATTNPVLTLPPWGGDPSSTRNGGVVQQ